MATVKFNETDEFVNELTKDANKVERSIVRIVFRTSFDSGIPHIHILTLVASAVVDGHVVRLERRCGSFWKETEEQKKVVEFAESHADRIRSACAEMKLEVRSGVFEAAA